MKPKLAEARDAVAEPGIRVLDRIPDRARRFFLNPVAEAALAAVAIAWLTWPVETIAPGLGLDPGWRAGVNMAVHQSLNFGEQVLFSYGPLGFLAYPDLYYPLNAAVAGVYVGLLQTATAGSLLWVARPSFGFFGAAVIALAISKMAILALPTTLLVPSLAFLWCVHAIRRSSDRSFLVVAIGGGLVGALELLVRLNVGIVVLALCGLTLAMECERRLRNLAVFVASALVSFLGFWLAAVQDLHAIPDYLGYSFEVVAGYSDAMGFEDPTRKWEYFAGAAVAAVVVFMGWRNTEGWSRRGRLKLVVLGALLADSTFKQAFVRHDVFHSGVWFITAAVVIVAVSWRRDRRVETALALVCALVALGAARVTPEQLNPIHSAENAVHQLGALRKSDRVMDDARTTMRSFYGFDERVLPLTHGRTVHIYGDETSAAWAYPEMRWHPLPAFHSYITYTRRLDKLNARVLSNDGPDFVLRGPDAPLDGRNFTLEAPETMLTMFCRYEPVPKVSADWQLLKRTANRCGTPRKLGSVRTRLGDRFAVPRGTGRGMIVMDVRELPTSLWQQVRSLIYRRNALYVRVNEARTFRMVPGTVTDWMIVRIPDAFDYPPPYPLSVDARSLRFFDDRGSHAQGAAMTVDFYEVPMSKRQPRS